MTELLKTADFKDIISIVDTLTIDLIDIDTLHALEVVYFTDPRTQIKFSRDVKDGYTQMIKIDNYHYAVYIETLASLRDGCLMSFMDVSTDNTDLSKGYFKNQVVANLGITLISSPI